jgi:hypothetical protein
MKQIYRIRRNVIALILFVIISTVTALNLPQPSAPDIATTPPTTASVDGTPAIESLKTLPIKGRAPKTDYSRDQFGGGWSTIQGCDTRNIILNRDLKNVTFDEQCNVTSGALQDPYTGKEISFKRGSGTSGDVQIDHVVALSDAWQTGAQQLSKSQRVILANDPLELLAVDGPANQQKSDGDAATWLPSNKPFRCQYVARQIAVKQKYHLWVTQAEHDAILAILQRCPDQTIPTL